MANEQGEQSQKNPVAAQAQHSWARTTMWVAIVLIFAGATLYVFKSCLQMPADVISRAGKTLKDVASAFNHGTITTSFISYATTISNQNYFQFATLKQTEIFSQEQQRVLLPDVFVEARAPVEYTYYLDLNGKWKFELRDNVVYVFAPPIKYNKPAIDASAITYEVRKGYVKTAEAQENLKKSLTGLVILRARENIPLVRENGRRQTTEFVEKWLMRSFTDGKEYPVKVYFPGEAAPGAVKMPDRPLN